MSTAVAAGAALGSAVAYAAGTVLQHRSARAEPPDRTLGLGLVLRLLARPAWIAGLAIDAVALALHVVAISEGELALVQPLLVSGLLFALPASVALDRRRPSLGEWAWAAVLVGGLALFLVAARPAATPSGTDVSLLEGMIVAGAVLAGLAAAAGLTLASRHRAALLGLAGGIGFGLTAALIKQAAGIGTGGHPLRLFDSWPLYALVVVGGAALAVTQVAYQSGPLAASLPPLTMADPIVAIAIGVAAFDENMAHDPAAVAVEVAAFVVMSVAAIHLARRSSPAEPLRQEL